MARPLLQVPEIIAASRGRPGELILNPTLALDGISGQPRWIGQTPLIARPPQFDSSLLQRGDSTHPPLLIGDGMGITVCRVALPTTPQGAIAPPRGAVWCRSGWPGTTPGGRGHSPG